MKSIMKGFFFTIISAIIMVSIVVPSLSFGDALLFSVLNGIICGIMGATISNKDNR